MIILNILIICKQYVKATNTEELLILQNRGNSKYITNNLIRINKFINNTKVTHCLYTDLLYIQLHLWVISEYMKFDATNIHYVSEYECVNEIFNREKSRLMENLNKIETKQ